MVERKMMLVALAEIKSQELCPIGSGMGTERGWKQEEGDGWREWVAVRGKLQQELSQKTSSSRVPWR